MDRWILSGTNIGNCVITELAAQGSGWQIYKARDRKHAIAAGRELILLWEAYSDSVAECFEAYDADGKSGDFMVFCSESGCLISSLDDGPYPGYIDQTDDMIDVFCGFMEKFPDADLRGAIYIEEKKLLLPVMPAGDTSGNGLALGRWMTHGVRVSIKDTAAVSRLVPWLSEPAIRRYADRTAKYIKGDAGGKAEGGARTAGRSASEQAGAVADAELYSIASRKEKIPDEDFSLPGSSKLEKFFNEEIVEIVRHADEYRRMGIGFPGAVLLYGPPGTGKTFAVNKLAEFLGWPRYDINSDSIGSTYIHETGMKIARVFDMAISNAPSVVVIDEMEAFLSSRTGRLQHQHHIEEVAEFLRKIPEATEKNVLVFGMTNVLEEIDPAILRRGRFDHMIEVGYADKDDIRALLEDRKKTLPIDESADLDRVARALAGRPMSDIAFVLKESGRYAVKHRQQTITNAAFEEAVSKLPKNRKKEQRIGFSV